MSILSLTFHTTESQISQWEKFLDEELHVWIANFQNINRYVLSNVETEMLTEGKNSNLLLFFENQHMRETFITTALPSLSEKINSQFGENVMIFTTHLNPLKQNI